MKSYLLCLIIGLGFYCPKLNAQSEQLEDKILEALSTLDQSQCASGRLYERVPEYYPFHAWRGDYLSDTTSFLISRFSMVSGMLRAMDVDQNSVLPSMDSIITDARNFKDSDTLRMGLILYNYDRFDTSSDTQHSFL